MKSKQLRQAAKLADATFLHTLQYLREGISELEVQDIIDEYINKRSDGIAFDTLINSSKYYINIHPKPKRKKLKRGDFLMMDFGTRLNGYCSDISRTVFIGGWPDFRQRFIYNKVLTAQLRAIKYVKPGTSFKTLTRRADKYFKMFALDKFFTHSIGHGISKEVHERPNYSEKIKAGDCITIEPGIYKRGFGSIRIEDMLIVKKDGIEILTTSPKKLITID